MDIRLIQEEDIENLFQAFKLAFENNRVPLPTSKEDFLFRLNRRLEYVPDISAAAHDGKHMVGFIVHGSGLHQGTPTAYNGGTGVVPGFRNQQTAEQIYEYLIPKIRSRFLARVLLEVVETNEQAIALYEKIGFTIKRRFKCYKLTKELSTDLGHPVEVGSMNDVQFNFNDFEPSFLDSSENLRSNEEVLIARVDGQVAGFLILQSRLGRISQLSVNRLYRGEKIGQNLVRAARKVTDKGLFIMNIPDDATGFDTFLKKCGFENQVNQFEMELII